MFGEPAPRCLSASPLSELWQVGSPSGSLLVSVHPPGGPCLPTYRPSRAQKLTCPRLPRGARLRAGHTAGTQYVSGCWLVMSLGGHDRLWERHVSTNCFLFLCLTEGWGTDRLRPHRWCHKRSSEHAALHVTGSHPFRTVPAELTHAPAKARSPSHRRGISGCFLSTCPPNRDGRGGLGVQRRAEQHWGWGVGTGS